MRQALELLAQSLGRVAVLNREPGMRRAIHVHSEAIAALAGVMPPHYAISATRHEVRA
jgi:hypothetical protein